MYRYRGVNETFPLKIANLVAWYDASQITGLSDNDLVTTWPDLSGNGYDLIQNDVALKPTYKASIKNGLPVIRFDGIDNELKTAAFGVTYSQPNTIIALGKFNSGTDFQYAYDGIDANFRHGLLIYDQWPYFSALTAGGDLGLVNYVGPIVGNYGQITAIYNGAASYLRSNQTFIASGDIGSQGLTGFKMGRSAAVGQPLNGDLCELMIFNRELTASEIWYLELYINRKWDVHPCSIYAIDNFTRSNSATSMGSCLSNQVWTAGSYQDASNPTIGISSNYGYFPSITGTDSHAYIESGISNCTITAKIKFDSGADSDKGIIFRRQDANNYFYVHIDSATDTLYLSRCLAGVRSDLDSVADATVDLGDEAYWKIYLFGTTIMVGSAQGKKYIVTTDSNMLTATKHGIYNHSGTQAAFGYFAIDYPAP
jgi:hypothetical protein